MNASFVLYAQDDNKVVFLYYPENDRRKGAGIIQYTKKDKHLNIRKFADLEWVDELTTEETKEKKNKGIIDFIDTTQPSKTYAFYGSPVLTEIHKQINLGIVPLEGKVS